MNDLHYSLNEVPPIWLGLIGLVLLLQGTWMFTDARKRGRFPWLWGLWGITGFRPRLLFTGLWLSGKRKHVKDDMVMVCTVTKEAY